MSDRDSHAELVEIATEWISLWCAPVNWLRFDALHTDSFQDCSPAGRPGTKQGFADGLADLVRVFPDLQTRITDLVVDETDSKVAVRWVAEGTNREPFLGVGPTNRLTNFGGIEIIHIRNGKVVRRWGEWDISAHLEAGY
ncbi:MAG: ester cyclase [Gammaproteobacteria bacterium]